MMKKITKAVITAAGLGTRMLPISKAVTKVMMPIVDKPAIEYLVDEAVAAGITDILIITNRGQEIIETYFDYVPEYDEKFIREGNTRGLAVVRESAEKANIFFLRQKTTQGLGHAVLCAESFVGNDDFIVMYGDDVIVSDYPVASQLCDVYRRFGSSVSVCAVNEVERTQLKKYCSLKIENIESAKKCSREFIVRDMIEKPQNENEIFSNYAILGRVLLTPEIFGILKNQKPGYNGEIQLTDAMRTLVLSSDEVKMIAKDFAGERHDIGSKFGFLRANVMEAVKNPEVKDEFTAFLKDFTKNL